MENHQQATEDYAKIAEKIRSGEFFRESRNIYDFFVHDPMAERYLYVLITAIASTIFVIAFSAMQSLYPLERSVPFIVQSADLADDLPNIRSMLEHKGEDIDYAMVRFLTSLYVTFREEYDIATFDRNVSGVKSLSAPEIFQDFQRRIDPSNPDSPITLYQRHSVRKIKILQVRLSQNEENVAEVVYETSVEGRGEVKKTRWQATIAFKYNNITLDEETGMVKQYTNPDTGQKESLMTVEKYYTKRLQDIK